jgi:hypothetical protein
LFQKTRRPLITDYPVALGQSLIGAEFIQAQLDFATAKKKTGASWVMWIALWTRPLWSML